MGGRFRRTLTMSCICFSFSIENTSCHILIKVYNRERDASSCILLIIGQQKLKRCKEKTPYHVGEKSPYRVVEKSPYRTVEKSAYRMTVKSSYRAQLFTNCFFIGLSHCRQIFLCHRFQFCAASWCCDKFINLC